MKVFGVLSLVLLTVIPAYFAFTLEDFSEIDETDDALLTRERRTYPTITFPCSRMPDVCKNMQNAMLMGKPSTLSRITDKNEIARNRCASGCPKKINPPGYNCDEYPFASSAQGGTGAVIMSVPIAENNLQGGLLAGFYRTNNIGNGDYYNVVLGP